jgi:hypothetical protein
MTRLDLHGDVGASSPTAPDINVLIVWRRGTYQPTLSDAASSCIACYSTCWRATSEPSHAGERHRHRGTQLTTTFSCRGVRGGSSATAKCFPSGEVSNGHEIVAPGHARHVDVVWHAAVSLPRSRLVTETRRSRSSRAVTHHHGIFSVTCPGDVIEMTPAHMHISFDVSSSAG